MYKQPLGNQLLGALQLLPASTIFSIRIIGMAMLVSMWALTSSVEAQIIFQQIPADWQLIPRVGLATEGSFEISGDVARSSAARRLSAKLFASGQLVDSTSQPLVFLTDTAQFAISLQIPVRRQNHTLQVYLDDQPVATVRYLVAGDVYLVNGQSNAVGNYALATPDRDSFLRGVPPSTGAWSLAQFANPGEWMGRAAKVISDQEQVPVAMFNFAVGAQPIRFFQPGFSGSDNFTEAEQTLAKAGVLGRIKGFTWFQGEADGWEASLKGYQTDLSALFDAYKSSFGVEHCYALQTRTYSCGHPNPFVMEAQRRLHQERTDYDLMATTNAVHDSCHFSYQGGYKLLGERLGALMRLRQYQSANLQAQCPNIDSARVTSPREITLYFNEYGAGLASTGNPWPEFRAEGLNVRSSAGRIVGKNVVLSFATDIQGSAGISYLSHKGPEPDFLHSGTGVGAFTFYNIPLVRGDGDPGNLPDAELVLRSEKQVLGTAELFSVTATLYNTGPTTLTAPVVQVPLPRPQLIYQGGIEGVTESGIFNFSLDQWRLESLAPGDSASLTLNYYIADASRPAMIWAQLMEGTPQDEDSEPGNGIPGEVHEDDEARLVIGDRQRDCVFQVESNDAYCADLDGQTFLSLTLRGQGQRPASSVLGLPQGEVSWPAGQELPLEIPLNDAITQNLTLLNLKVVSSTDASCGSKVTAVLPQDCQFPLGIRSTRKSGSLQIFPNPLRSGQKMFVVYTTATTSEMPQVQLFNNIGQKIAFEIFPEASLDRFVIDQQLAPGHYFLRVGDEVAQLVVY